MLNVMFGRYLRIGSLVSGQALNLQEIEAFGSDAELLKPSSAAMKSVWLNNEKYGASNCIDGSKDGQLCHSQNTDNTDWIRVDYGKNVAMAKIVITNRIGETPGYNERGRIAGATVSITHDEAGKQVVWAGILQGTQDVYTFTFNNIVYNNDPNFVLHQDKECTDQNDIMGDETPHVTNFEACRALCLDNTACISFEWHDARYKQSLELKQQAAGGCSGSEVVGTYTHHGATRDGKPYYFSGDRYLYYDADCSGGSGSLWSGRWIVDTSEPSTTAMSDLDADGAGCEYVGRVSSLSVTPPAGIYLWKIVCDSTWTDVRVEVIESGANELGLNDCHLSSSCTSALRTTAPGANLYTKKGRIFMH